MHTHDTTVVICHNVSSMTENRWLQPQFKYYIVHKAIVRHTRETIFNFGPKSNC